MNAITAQTERPVELLETAAPFLETAPDLLASTSTHVTLISGQQTAVIESLQCALSEPRHNLIVGGPLSVQELLAMQNTPEDPAEQATDPGVTLIVDLPSNRELGEEAAFQHMLQSIGGKIIVCSDFTEAPPALKEGKGSYGKGLAEISYVSARLGVTLLADVIQAVDNGAPPRVIGEWQAATPHAQDLLAKHLTNRERECLLYLVEGLDTRAMVDCMGISRTTVRTHVNSTLTKLGVHSRLEAAAYAVRHDLFT